MAPTERVLLVEDEPFVRDSLAEVLGAEGFEVLSAGTVDEAEALLERAQVTVALCDLRLPGRDGVELLPTLADAGIPVVVLTGHGTVDDAVAAMKAGAFDFVQKPIEPEALAIAVRRAAEHGRLVDEVTRLRDRVGRLGGRRTLAGGSPALVEVRRLAEQVARTDATVLVTGESGTGKELVATQIHTESARAAGPLVVVNCAAVVSSLFESEFFGHRRGSFSGATADRTGRFAEAAGGTLVLDEIETLDVDLQAKLLRVLESGEYQMVGESRTRTVDVRVVAVSNEDLQARVKQGEFRADLFYRLNVFPIHVPPLREHKADLPEITAELFARVRERLGAGTTPRDLDERALGVLAAYDWPGNVRELRNVLERAAILAGPGCEIGAELLRDILGPAASAARAAAGAARPEGLNLRERLDALERELLDTALERTAGRRKEAAALLGVDPKNLSYYLRKHGLTGGPEER